MVNRPKRRVVQVVLRKDHSSAIATPASPRLQGIFVDRQQFYPVPLPFPCGLMAEGSGFLPNPAMGRDLMAGHVHRDRYGRSPAPAASHRPAGKKRMQQAVSDRSPKRAEAPEIPRLRALEAQAAAIPISSSAASSTSPRSGSSRVNPYPVGEATESSPFEIVPSAATQATHSWEQGGSLDLTPIRDDTSPTTPSSKPIHIASEKQIRVLASA